VLLWIRLPLPLIHLTFPSSPGKDPVALSSAARPRQPLQPPLHQLVLTTQPARAIAGNSSRSRTECTSEEKLTNSALGRGFRNCRTTKAPHPGGWGWRISPA